MGKKKMLILVAEEDGLDIDNSPLRQISASELADSKYYGDAYYKAEDKKVDQLKELIVRYGVEVTDENIDLIKEVQKKDAPVYNSLKLKIIENTESNYWINFHHPKTAEEIQDVIGHLGMDGTYADSLDKKLDGDFLINEYPDEDDNVDYDKIIQEPIYYHVIDCMTDDYNLSKEEE